MDYPQDRREELERAERLWRERLEQLPDWLWEVDLDLVHSYSNPLSEAVLGYRPEEILGRCALEWAADDQARDRMRAAAEEAARTGASCNNLIFRFRHKDGSVRSVQTSGVCIKDSEGRVVGFRGITRDVTEQEMANQAAAEQLANYKAATDGSPIGIFIQQNEMAVYANPKVLELVGYEWEDRLRVSIWDIIHPDDVERIKGYYAQRMRNEPSPETYEVRVYTKSGDLRVFEIKATTVTYSGAPAVLGNVIDITDRNKAEEALRSNERFLQSIFDSIQDGISILDTEFNIVRVNKTMERWYSHALPLVGRKCYEAYHGRTELCEVCPSRRSLDGCDTQMDILPVHGADGSVMGWHELYSCPLLDDEGNVTGIVEHVRDVTDRVLAEEALREKEEKYRALVETISDWVWEVDENARYTYVSPRIRDLLGYEPEEVLGKTPFDLMSAEEAQRIEAEFAHVTEQCGPFSLFDNVLLHKDGHEVAVQTSGAPVFDAEGRFRGYRGIDRDITELRRANEALRYRLEFEQVITSISTHLIRTPSGEIDRAVDYSLEAVGRFMAVDRSYVFVNRADGVLTDETHEWCAEGVKPSIQAFQAAPLEEHRWAIEQLRRGDVVYIRNIEDLPSEAETTKEMARTGGNRSLILVPMSWMGRWIGFMGLDSLRERSWPEDAIVLLRVVGELLSGALMHQRNEEALCGSEERYRVLFERNPDAVMVLLEGHIIEANPALANMLGYDQEELIGMTPWEISPEHQPDGSPSREKAKAVIARALNDGPQMFNWVHMRKDGSLVDCEILLTTYQFHGEAHVQAIIRDITERKRAEEDRRALEKQLEAQKRHFYRETILSVTDGKLSICDPPELRPYISRAMLKFSVRGAEQVAEARHLAEEFLREQGLEGERLDSFVIGIGEAITNAVKHANGGRLYAGVSDDDFVWVGVADRGRGISSLILPRATLLRGFSTKPSLGLGYTIMLDVADSILLKTGETGTTVILVQRKHEPMVELSPEALPDTWKQIAL